MANFHPRLEDMPGEFPVFPLPGALLLPRGKLPLRIFEPRYLAMTEDALGQGRMFGMIQPDPTVPDTATGPALFRVGCLGRLSSFSETDEGHYLITLTGVIRFAIADRDRDAARLSSRAWRVRPISRRPGPGAAVRSRCGASRCWRRCAAISPIAASTPTGTRSSNCRTIFWSTTLAMVCPFEPAEKQALLEAPTDAERAAALLTLLQMGALAQDTPGGRSVS